MESREESPVGTGIALGSSQDAYVAVAVDVAEISTLEDVETGHGGGGGIEQRSARNEHRQRRLGRTASGSLFSGPKSGMSHSKSFTALSLLRQVGMPRGSPAMHPSHSCDAGGSSLSAALTSDAEPAAEDNEGLRRPLASTEEASSSRWRYMRDLSAVQGSATNAIAAAKRLFNSTSLTRHGSFHRLSGDVLVIRRVGDSSAVGTSGELMTDIEGKPLPGASLHVQPREGEAASTGSSGEEDGSDLTARPTASEELALSESIRAVDGISSERCEGKSGRLDEISGRLDGKSGKLVDIEGKEVEEQEIPYEEAICRICHSELNEGGEVFKLECACRGDLALAHKDCAVKWFRLKGTSTCEVCKNEVKNLVVELQRRASPNETLDDDVMTRQRARVEVSGLMLTSMPAYFCYFERLVHNRVNKDENRRLLISLPLGCLVGIASTMAAQAAAPSHMWAYAGLQFLLIVACTLILENRTDLKPPLVAMLGSLAGMALALIVQFLGREIWLLARGQRRNTENREEAAQPPPSPPPPPPPPPAPAAATSTSPAVGERGRERADRRFPARRLRWNGLVRGSGRILGTWRQQGPEGSLRPVPVATTPSNSEQLQTASQTEGSQHLQPSFGPIPEGLHWMDTPMIIPGEERVMTRAR